jgi:hypothetical protein
LTAAEIEAKEQMATELNDKLKQATLSKYEYDKSIATQEFNDYIAAGMNKEAATALFNANMIAIEATKNATIKANEDALAASRLQTATDVAAYETSQRNLVQQSYEQTTAKMSSLVSAFGSTVSSYANYESTLIQNNLKKKVDASNKEYTGKKANLDLWLKDQLYAIETMDGTEEEKRLKSEEAQKQYTEKMKALDEDKSRNQQKWQEEAAEAEAESRKKMKPFLIAEAIANTALGATKAFAQGGMLGFATAALITAAGMAQVATINAQQFASGGIVGGSSYVGDNVAASVNSGEMILNRGQQSKLFAIANGAGSSGTGGNQTFTTGDIIINGDVDGNNIDRIATQLREAVKTGQIEAVNMAKVISKVGGTYSSEAI